MKKLIAAAILALLCGSVWAQLPTDLPMVLDLSSGVNTHVQGIAVNREKGEIYYSFTTRFIRTDLRGRVLGTIDRIQGHLGAMTYNPADGFVYASLECKNDEIGAGIAKKLGVSLWDGSYFYVAIIDVAKVDQIGINPENDPVFRTVCLREPIADYAAQVALPEGVKDHRFGCSGIDGVTIAPAPAGIYRTGALVSRVLDSPDYLYVAYGIYGDVDRTDNDYQILLSYPLEDLKSYAQPVSFGTMHTSGPKRPWRKYFVRTGNTTYGVQNLAYDPFTGYLLMAVYRGKKAQYPNYSLYAVDLAAPSFRGRLEGVPYRSCKVQQLSLAADGLTHEASGIRGWNFRWGSTGLFPLGGGYYLFSESYKGLETGIEGCRTHLMRWTGDPAHPFAPARD